MNSSRFERTFVLPHLEIVDIVKKKGIWRFFLKTQRRPMVCLRCASICKKIYDQRNIKLRDEKIRNFHVILHVQKKRYWCKSCKRPQTETLDGVLPGKRTTQRYKRWIMKLCESYSCLEDVRREAKCSKDFVYKAYYEQLDLESRKRRNPWPKVIGIDEHSFKRRRGYGGTEFASMIVDHKNKKVIEVVEGKTTAALDHSLAYIPGASNVEVATLDMCDSFRGFVKKHFPNAQIVADKFHVLRLLNHSINRVRKEITGDRRTLRVRRLLMRSRKNLSYEDKRELDCFLSYHPRLEELYEWKERLHSFYRVRGYFRAKEAFLFMLDEMSRSRSPEIIRLRKTLQKWNVEILNYFRHRYTNARVEGFNNVAKTIKKRGYGFRSFKNYRLRVLNACF